MLCAVLAISVYGAFAQEEVEVPGDGGAKMCDASNQNKCIITGVGEGTGRLVAN